MTRLTKGQIRMLRGLAALPASRRTRAELARSLAISRGRGFDMAIAKFKRLGLIRETGHRTRAGVFYEVDWPQYLAGVTETE